MGFSDRRYSQGGPGGDGNDWGRRLLAYLNKAFPIGTYADIRVQVHITFFFVLLFRLVRDGDLMWTLRWSVLLFFSVLLHEFGHALSCRAVGGTANHILMWPLGGLAMVSPPHRAKAHFITIACGPLVNVVIAGVCYLILLVVSGSDMAVGLNPLNIWQGDYHGGVVGLIEDLFYINYFLLLFNLALLFYPFDGGRLVQAVLWMKIGYARSMKVATVVGMAGAVGVVFYGLAVGEPWLLLIALFGFVVCYKQWKMLKYGGPQYDTGVQYDTGANYDPVLHAEHKPGWFSRMHKRRMEGKQLKEQRRREQEEAEIDRILAKVHREGLASLSEREKKLLQNATRRQKRQ